MNRKKVISILVLCLVICLSIVPYAASASQVVPYASDVIDYTSLTLTTLLFSCSCHL